MITRDPHILRRHIRALHSVPWPHQGAALRAVADPRRGANPVHR
jgi:hypothetical protein